MGEGTLSPLRDEVDFTRGKVRDIGLIAEAEAVALLGLLTIEEEAEDMIFPLAAELDLDPVGVGDSLAELLGLDTHVVVIDGEAAGEDDLVDPMQGRAAESVLLRKSRQRGGRREGRDAEDDVVVRVDILGEAHLFALGSEGLVGEVEVAAAGKLISEDLPARETHLCKDLGVERLVERLNGVLLNRERRILQESVVLDLGGIFQIDQDAEALAGLGPECRFEKSLETEGRKGTCGDALCNRSGHVNGRFVGQVRLYQDRVTVNHRDGFRRSERKILHQKR